MDDTGNRRIDSLSVDIRLTDYDYVRSALGNAIYSGLSITDLWPIICVADTAEEFDQAVDAAIRLKEILNDTTATRDSSIQEIRRLQKG